MNAFSIKNTQKTDIIENVKVANILELYKKLKLRIHAYFVIEFIGIII
jgi:hypothetical protein